MKGACRIFDPRRREYSSLALTNSCGGPARFLCFPRRRRQRGEERRVPIWPLLLGAKTSKMRGQVEAEKTVTRADHASVERSGKGVKPGRWGEWAAFSFNR